MKYLATVVPGLEEVSAAELRKFGAKVLKIRKNKGRIIFEGNKDLWKKLNFFSRSLERIIMLFDIKIINNFDLKTIYNCVYSIEWENLLDPGKTFAVKTTRHGEHPITSMEIAGISGQAIIDRYLKEKNKRLKVNLNNPDTIVRVDLIENQLFIGIDTTGEEGLQKRKYRVYNHPAHLNSCIAYSLIKLSGYEKNKCLLDPMCGSGTIPIEASMFVRKIPPGKFDSKRRFGFRWKEHYFNDLEIYGIEKFKKHYLGAIKNAESAGVYKNINFINKDCLKYLSTTSDNYDCIVFNPPYGIRIGKKNIVRKLYFKLFDILKTFKGSTVSLITTEKNIMGKIINEMKYQILNIRYVKYGGLDTWVYVLHI